MIRNKKPVVLTKLLSRNVANWFKRAKKAQIEPLTTNSFTFVGHSTVAIDLDGIQLISDPILFNNLAMLRKKQPIDKTSLNRKYDFILITHAHHDHLHYPSLRALDSSATIIAPMKFTQRLRRAGLPNPIIELRPSTPTIIKKGDQNLVITGFVCNHDGRRGYTGRPIDTLGYLIEGKEHSVFLCGDTAYTRNFDRIEADVAFMPVGCYTPVDLEEKHCNPEQSYKMFCQMKQVDYFVPIHFGTLTLSLDQDHLTLERLVSLRNADKRVKIYDIGRNISLKRMRPNKKDQPQS